MSTIRFLRNGAIWSNASSGKQLVEYCQRQSWDYIEYTDRMTGTRADRRAFVQMFEDAWLKHFDMVLFWALDRFSSEGKLRTLEYLQRLYTYGVAWKEFHRLWKPLEYRR